MITKGSGPVHQPVCWKDVGESWRRVEVSVSRFAENFMTQ
jgi:hypothetical protein